MCGAFLGWYIGGFLSPLVTFPLLAVAVVGIVLCGPTLLPTAGTTLLPLLYPCGLMSFSLVGMVVPLTTAVIGGKLGYDHATTFVDAVVARTERAPESARGSRGQMAY